MVLGMFGCKINLGIGDSKTTSLLSWGQASIRLKGFSWTGSYSYIEKGVQSDVRTLIRCLRMRERSDFQNTKKPFFPNCTGKLNEVLSLFLVGLTGLGPVKDYFI